jgi:ELWxxDGT repeat protein
MKKSTHLFLSTALVLGGLSASAQTLLKDLRPGAHPASSNPKQFTNVNGTLYFLTRATSGPLAISQLWKSDGTGANTTLVKDSILITNLTNAVKIVAGIADTVYYTVTPYSSSSTYSPELWRSDGTTAGTTLVTTLTYTTGTGGGPPDHFTPLGNKLFFNFGLNHGRELWVSNGTAAGTMEVTDLAPGTSGSQQIPGVDNQPMIAFNGKVYFAGATTLGDFELYASDGTAAGTTLVQDLRPGAGSASPEGWNIWNNELYFIAADGSKDNLWKTDGTITTQLTNTVNCGASVIFRNQLFFAGGINLWKSDGTVAGTVFVADSVITSGFSGANDDYLFSTYMKYLSVPPYYEYHYMRTDGTLAGTVEVSSNLYSSVSFNVIDNKMYTVRPDSGSSSSIGLWESDGTSAGVKLFSGYSTGSEFIFNDTVFFADYTAAVGYEPFFWAPATATGVESPENNNSIMVYPNPSSGIFNVKYEGNPAKLAIEVYSLVGEKVLEQKQSATIDLSGAAPGIYFIKVLDGKTSRTQKIILQ